MIIQFFNDYVSVEVFLTIFVVWIVAYLWLLAYIACNAPLIWTDTEWDQDRYFE